MPLFGTTNLLSSPLSHSLSLSTPTITSQSSVICQGLHSLDSQTTDTNTTLRLKLSLPLQEMNKNPSNPNLGIWNSLQSLSPSSRTPKQEGTYAHPILTEKSLELCTENLGSETGSDTDFSLSSPDFGGGNGEISTVGKPNSHLEKECKIVTGQCADKLAWRAELPRKEMEGRKVNFPPPLTTLSGSGSVRVRACREEGRLIVKAVGGPLENSTSTSFRAERSNGRLRLCFWEEDWDSDEMDFQENQESEIYVEGSGEEEEDEDEDEESEDMSGNDMDVEGEMGMEKFERPRWCKGSGGCGNGSLWPSWVATS